MTPTAKALGLDLNTQFSTGDERQMVESILSSPAYQGRTVVICWKHTEIPKIVEALGGTGVPPVWPAASFDRFWIFNSDGSFEDRPQLLLPGDQP